jgi:hypothetical protein
MRRLWFILLPAALLAQNPNSPVFPSAVANDQNLLVAKNRASSTLTANISASATSIPVADGSKFTAPLVVAIGNEYIKVCSISGNTLTVCTGGRGFDGSTAAAHSSGAEVRGVYAAHHHNQLAAEVKAIETALGANLGNVAASSHSHTAAGDVTGNLNSTVVERIRGRVVSSAAPSPRDVPTWSGSQWEPKAATPSLFSPRIYSIALANETSNLETLGMTLYDFGSRSAVDLSSGSNPHLLLRSSTSSNHALGAGPGTNPLGRFRRDEVFRAYIRIGSTTSIRHWIALVSDPSIQEQDTPSDKHVAGFRYSTNASDTTYRCVTCNTSSCTVNNSGVTADTNLHLFEVEWTGSAYQFRIDGNVVCTNTTNLPAANQPLGIITRVFKLSSGDKTIDIGGLYYERNF